MATHYERVLIQHCVITESMNHIAHEFIDAEMMPTEELRKVLVFCNEYWFEGGADVAPTPDVLRVHFANLLVEHEIDLDTEPDGTVQWAISALRQSWIDGRAQGWVMDWATKFTQAELTDKADILNTGITQLMEMSIQITSTTEHVDVRHAVGDALERYEQRAVMRQTNEVAGLRFGYPLIDGHTSGIRSGELVIVAAPPKTGKSWWLLWTAYEAWRNGEVPVLYSLENSVQMTVDRLACMVLSIDARRWDRGDCTEDEVQRVRTWRDSFETDQERFGRPFHILQPEPGKRTIQHMVRQAQLLGDVVLIDQLTFVEPAPAMERKSKTEQIGYSLHQLKAITAGSIPAVLAHQINRDGVKMAEKAGRLEMYHLAESAEVERTADWVFGMWQSRGLREVNRMQIQSLAARRADLVHWELAWQPWIGFMQEVGTVNLDDAA